MSRAFAAALRTLHADPSLSTAAEYRAGGVGAPVGVHVLLRRPEEIAGGLGGPPAVVGALEAEILAEELPAAPSPGDTLTIGSIVYRIAGAPQADVDRVTFLARLTT